MEKTSCQERPRPLQQQTQQAWGFYNFANAIAARYGTESFVSSLWNATPLLMQAPILNLLIEFAERQPERGVFIDFQIAANKFTDGPTASHPQE
jgi:hypothetical protein